MKFTFDLSSELECSYALTVVQIFHPDLMEDHSAPVAETTPEATAPIVVDPTAGVELDANGTPWLAEVHATTRTQTKKGVWKGKRGGDKDELAAAEQVARDKIAGAPTPVVPTEPVVQASAQAAPVITMDDVSRVWQEALTAEIVDTTSIMEIYAQIGVDPAQLNTNETMRAAFYNHLVGLVTPANVVNIPGM